MVKDFAIVLKNSEGKRDSYEIYEYSEFEELRDYLAKVIKRKSCISEKEQSSNGEKELRKHHSKRAKFATTSEPEPEPLEPDLQILYKIQSKKKGTLSHEECAKVYSLLRKYQNEIWEDSDRRICDPDLPVLLLKYRRMFAHADEAKLELMYYAH